MQKRIFWLFALIVSAGSGWGQVPDSLLDQIGQTFPTEAAYLKEVWDDIPANLIPGGLIHQRSDMLADLSSMTGKEDSSRNYLHFLLAYMDIRKAHVADPEMPEPDAIVRYVESRYFTYTHEEGIAESMLIPIGLMHYEYNSLKENAFENGLISTPDSFHLQVEGSTNPFEQKTMFLATPMYPYRALNRVQFMLDPALIFTNLPEFTSYEVDFGDGQGFVPVIPGQIYPIEYSTPDSEGIQLRVAAYQNPQSTPLITVSFIEPDPSNDDPGPGSSGGGVSCDIPDHSEWLADNCEDYWNDKIMIPGVFTFNFEAEAKVIWGCGNTTGKPMKPVVLVAGFWPQNFEVWFHIQTFKSLYRRANKEDLLWNLHRRGYDLFFFRPDNGHDSLDYTVRLLQFFLEDLNNDKGTGAAENVVIGYSSGALAARYALAQMEQNHTATVKRTDVPDAAHQARLYISYDGEHQGANIPLGIQHALVDNQGMLVSTGVAVAGGTGGAIGSLFSPIGAAIGATAGAALGSLVQVFLNTSIKSVQASQLLRHHYSVTGNVSFPASGPAAGHTAFYGRMNALRSPAPGPDGYPCMARRVAIGDGAATAIGFGFNPGAVLFDIYAHDRVGTTKHKRGTVIRAFGAGQTTVYSRYNMRRYGWQNSYQLVSDNSFVTAGGVPADHVNGSTSNLMQVGGAVARLYAYYAPGNAVVSTATTSNECFNPTTSAFDIHQPDGTALTDHLYSLPGNNLLYQDPNDNDQSDNFGYPHIKEPNTTGASRIRADTSHYNLTPFHAIFALEENKLHGVKSENSTMMKFLLREIDSVHTYLQNQTVANTGPWAARFQSLDNVVVGSDVAYHIRPDAGVTVSAGKSLMLEAKNSITLKAGTSIQAGAVFSAKISNIALCWPTCESNRPAGSKSEEAELVSTTDQLQAWPNPANGHVTLAAPEGHTLTAVQLIDMQGSISVISVPENAAEISLMLPDVGLFIVRARYEDGSWHTTKIVSVSGN